MTKSRFHINKECGELVDHLFLTRKNYDDEDNLFDYPDYGGLPKKITNKLSSDCVDRLQEYLPRLAKTRSKKRFEEEIIPLVVGDFIIFR